MINVTHNDLPKAVMEIYQKLDHLEKLIIEKNQIKQDSDELMNIKDAAKLINLSVPTIYGLTSKSQIPFHKKGKRLYFSKKELIEWVKEGPKKATVDNKKGRTTLLI